MLTSIPFSLRRRAAAALSLLLLSSLAPAAEEELPHLRRQGSATQLIVDGKPLVMLAGELHNSSASGVEYMRKIWPKLAAIGLNTVVAPVSWELIEPEEGRFDFTLVDALLDQARRVDQRLVLLWFGSWKNGASSYVPLWVLRDMQRFPRAQGSSHQNSKDMLSTLGPANVQADAAAFARLMRHLREADGKRHTVVLVQVENEVGIKPERRDQSDLARAGFQFARSPRVARIPGQAPQGADAELRDRWAKSRFAASGTWAELFGGDGDADEVFSAWHYARYIDAVAAAGQAEYNLPMYVNAWLATQPGTYPSGGPVAHMHDVWRAAAPHLAVLAPDIYTGEFKEVCSQYARPENPLWIPEVHRDVDNAGRVWWAIAQHQALGFSPFGIESLPADDPLIDAYGILRQLLPQITAAHGTGRMVGVFRQNSSEADPGLLEVGDYRVQISYEKRLPAGRRPIGGLVIQTGPAEFLVAGYGFGCHFTSKAGDAQRTEIGRVELGHFDSAGGWVHELWLNGDETGANYLAHIPPFSGNECLGVNRPMILRVTLYTPLSLGHAGDTCGKYGLSWPDELTQPARAHVSCPVCLPAMQRA